MENKNILVVDDSALMRRVLCDIISSIEQFQVADVAKDGQEALDFLLAGKNYDVILLDINMPRMDGIQFLEELKKRRIHATIVMVSTLTTENAEITIRAMELGAVDFVTKPDNIVEAKGVNYRTQISNMLRAVMATKDYKRVVAKQPQPTEKRIIRSDVPVSSSKEKLVALACSTGGPKALQSVIPFLKKNMNAPMVLVQHMPVGFTKSMADRLDSISEVEVKEAEEGEILKKGVVYVAPGGSHLEVVPAAGGEHKAHLCGDPPIGGLKPCANIMYRSLMKCNYGEVVCVVLTGMGADGTEGILQLEQKKRIHVIAQNAETCVVYGMPRAVAEAGVVDEVVPLESVADTIIKNVGVR